MAYLVVVRKVLQDTLLQLFCSALSQSNIGLHILQNIKASYLFVMRNPPQRAPLQFHRRPANRVHHLQLSRSER